MLQSGLDITPGHHASFPCRPLRGCVRRDPLGRDRQGAPVLERRAVTSETVRPCAPGRAREIRGAGLEKPERVLTSPQGARVGVRGREGEVLNFCANNYLGLADHPDVIAAAHARARPSGATAWRRSASSAGRRTSTRSWRQRLSAFLGTGRHDPLLVLLRRERRAVRDAARRGGRGHLRRAEPREHHRRRPALQGAAVPLPQQRHGRPRGAAEGGGRSPAPI